MDPILDSVKIDFRQRDPTGTQGHCDVIVSVAHLNEVTLATQIANVMIDLLMSHFMIHSPTTIVCHLPDGVTPDGAVDPSFNLPDGTLIYNEVLAIGMAFGVLNPNHWHFNFETVEIWVQSRSRPMPYVDYRVGIQNGVLVMKNVNDPNPQTYVISPS